MQTSGGLVTIGTEPRVSRPGPIGQFRYAEAPFSKTVEMVPEKKELHVAEQGL